MVLIVHYDDILGFSLEYLALARPSVQLLYVPQALSKTYARGAAFIPLLEAYSTAQVILPTDLDLPEDLQNMTVDNLWIHRDFVRLGELYA